MLRGVLDGIGDTLDSLDGRATFLIQELDPRTTSEMLTDWERMLGLPDECAGQPDTLEERRDAVVQKLTGIGSSTPAGLIAMALALGYGITIEEHDPLESRCGIATMTDIIGGGQWGHTFTVHAPTTSFTTIAKCGAAQMGDPLRDWGNDILECAILRAKPAHTMVIFAYDL